MMKNGTVDFHKTDMNIVIFKSHHTFIVLIPTFGNNIVVD
jgi:hypothetical protein